MRLSTRLTLKGVELINRLIDEHMHTGNAQSMTTKLVERIALPLAKVYFKQQLLTMDFTVEHDIDVEMYVHLDDNGAVMDYRPQRRAIRIPLSGLRLQFMNLQHPDMKQALADAVGRPVTFQEVIKEFLAHELGHSDDDYLVKVQHRLFAMVHDMEMLNMAHSDNPHLSTAKRIQRVFDDIADITLKLEYNAIMYGRKYAVNKELYDKLNEMVITAYKRHHRVNKKVIQDEIDTLSSATTTQVDVSDVPAEILELAKGAKG